jgi:putative ABC transport system permease protein
MTFVLESLLLDVRYAFRALFRNRRFTLAALTSLALGIGLNTALFSVVNAVLLRPFPYADPGRLVIIWGTKSFDVRRGMTREEFEELRKSSGVFQDVAEFQINPVSFALGSDQTDVVRGAVVGSRAFPVLGVQPVLGRGFLEAPEDQGDANAVILSYGLWRARFGGNHGILGQAIDMNGAPYTVVGVMPPEFFFPDESVQLWVPLTRATGLLDQVQAIARFRRGATIGWAQAELDTLGKAHLERRSVASPAPLPGVFPLRRVVVGRYEAALAALLAATGLLVLIGCANVSNLLLARGVGRERELGVRTSLGASRGRLLQLILVENTLLSLVAGAAGLGCAWWGVRLLRGLRLTDLPRFGSATVDTQVLLFALGVSLAAGLVSGVVPGWKATQAAMPSALQPGGSCTSPRREGELRNLLVTIEVALALILVAGAGILISSFSRLARSDWGFKPEKLLLVRAPLPRSLAEIPGRRVEYGNQVLGRLSRVPGVTSCAMTYGVPIWYGYRSATFALGGRMVNWTADLWDVGPNYFRTMETPVLRGREFDKGDNELAAPRVVVNKAFAEKLWPGKDPIGRYIQMLKLKKDLEDQARRDPRNALPREILERPGSWEPDGAPREVVGEVGNVRAFGLDLVPGPDVYVDYRQERFLCCAEDFVVRTSSDPRKFASVVKGEILAVESNVTRVEVAGMSDLVNQSIGGRGSNKLLLVISTLFGSLSLFLAAVGIYGVVSFSVAQRTRELGIRRALGAGEVGIIVMVIGQIMRPLLFGLILGLGGVFGVAGVLKGLLFGITPTDPLMLAGTCILLVAAAAMACAVPTLRALRVSPSDALRYE